MTPLSLVDLVAQQLSLVATCETCGRGSGQWHPWRLIERCEQRGWSQDLADVAKRFRCARCGPSASIRVEQVPTVYPKERIMTRAEEKKARRGEGGYGFGSPRQAMGAYWWRVVKR